MARHASEDEVNILIVDDRPDKVLALEAVLEELAQRVVRAYSGKEALRQVLANEFAVILLDVNMPDMDGFETASLIRQRRSSLHTPIIFVTAFGDEMHEARFFFFFFFFSIPFEFEAGAVDYILAPVVPAVLRTKVAVFVDLFRKSQQLRRHAETLGRRANQKQKLAAVSLAINRGAASLEELLQIVTDAARDIVGAQQAITLLFGNANVKAGRRPTETLAVTSFSEKYADWKKRPLQLDNIARTIVAQSRTATRLSETELHDHPDWHIVREVDFPGVRGGMVAAPLVGRDGQNFGVIYLSDRVDGDFSRDDEAVLVQLAQMVSIAVENVLFAKEREANRLKDEFLATLSHELRTPLTAILGWAQILKRQKQTPMVEQGLDVIDRNVRSQLRLIEDLLDVSRITEGKLRLQTKPLSVGQIVAGVLDAVRPAGETKGITLLAAGDESANADTVIGDEERLQQVIWNLVNNAVKFTPAGGKVEVRTSIEKTEVVVVVSDTGEGIHPSFLPHVFDRFRQADSSTKRFQAGLGIGLAIVRHIVEMHGGSVAAHSDGEGRGARFIVRLPLHNSAVQKSNGQGAISTGLPSSQGPRLRLADANESAGPPAIEGLRVLLVEDVDDSRETLARLLRDAGATVTPAASVAEALERFADARADVVVSDIGMPGQDGFDLVRQIRPRPSDSGGCTPAVALTAYARDEDRVRILAAGFQAHAVKPIEPDDFIRLLSAFAPVGQNGVNGQAQRREAQ